MQSFSPNLDQILGEQLLVWPHLDALLRGDIWSCRSVRVLGDPAFNCVRLCTSGVVFLDRYISLRFGHGQFMISCTANDIKRYGSICTIAVLDLIARVVG